MRVTPFFLVTITITFAAYSACTSPSPPAVTNPQGYCAEAPIRTEALDNPSKHAWDLFLTINHPARDKTVARGEPDCSKRIGTPGTTAVWETWRNASTEVFLKKGAEPPEWPDTSLEDEKPGTVPAPPAAEPAVRFKSLHDSAAVASVMGQHFAPEGIFPGIGAFGETRMNRATYDFIRNECLFSNEGLKRYAQAIMDGKKPPISFPPNSIEVKAAWLDLQEKNIPQEKWKTYYTAEYKERPYGLVALHVITKDLPNWFWATFHHKDAPDNHAFEVHDSYGQPKILAGTVWENYELGGTQTDFVKPTGGPTILSDYYVENGFQRSSCITCHATATISPEGRIPDGGRKALCSLTPNLPDFDLPLSLCRALLGDDAFKPGTDELRVERGAPDPHWFEKDGKPYYLQTDFVWSVPARAQQETVPPPGRCIW